MISAYSGHIKVEIIRETAAFQSQSQLQAEAFSIVFRAFLGRNQDKNNARLQDHHLRVGLFIGPAAAGDPTHPDQGIHDGQVKGTAVVGEQPGEA